MATIAALFVMGGSGILAGQATAARSPMFDLIQRGKASLNDFRYRSADSIWQQLLSRPLMRQQRIEVLQLLAATLYPDDAAEQRKDSAKAVLAQLAGMGVKRMVVRDASWPGLDTLYAGVVATYKGSMSSQLHDSVQDVIGLLNDGYLPGEIPERVSIDCYSFAFEDLENQVRRFSGASALPGSLKQLCTRLYVESEPADARLMVGQRDLGVVTPRGTMRWVQPAAGVELALSRGTARMARTIDFPAGKFVHVRMTVPQDTTPWQPIGTAEEIGAELGIFSNYAPTSPRPPEPVQPRTRSALKTGLLWGLVGGAAGFAVGQFLPAARCTVMETVPAGQTWKVRGTRYSGGDEVNMGGGMACVATVSGGAGISLFTATALRQGLRNRSVNSRYRDEMQAYPAIVQQWEAKERLGFAERNPQVRQAMIERHSKLQEVRAANARIRSANSGRVDPQITVRDLRPADLAPAAAPPPR